MVKLPEALVLRWDDRTLHVRCPYCLYSHAHAFSPPRDVELDTTRQGWRLDGISNRRRSDCTSTHIGGEYVFVFPQSNTPLAMSYGWEVDCDNCEFRAVDHDGKVEIPREDWRDGRTLLLRYREQPAMEPIIDNESDEDEIDVLTGETESLTLEDARKKSTSTPKAPHEMWEELCLDPKFRTRLYFSHCVLKRIRDLESLFDRYPTDSFVGATTEEGDNGALLAATEENGLDTLMWLEERGCSIQKANYYGRTPLMEAALWGRFETAQYLTGRGAKIGARDGNGMRAVELAADTARNIKERARRSGDIYREPADAARQRRQIEALLQRLSPSTAAAKHNVSNESRPRAFFDRQADGRLVVLWPRILLKPPGGPFGPQLQKAFATLDRGYNYPPVNAMSGYSQAGWPNVIDNKLWTANAENLRTMLGMPEDKSAASHVEPQLLAYVMYHHSVLPMLESERRRRDLRGAMPAYNIRPTITVNKDRMCQCCDETFERFKHQYPGFNVVFRFEGDSLRPPLSVRS